MEKYSRILKAGIRIGRSESDPIVRKTRGEVVLREDVGGDVEGRVMVGEETAAEDSGSDFMAVNWAPLILAFA